MNVCTNFQFSMLYFRVTSPCGTDGRTDGRRGKTRNAVYSKKNTWMQTVNCDYDATPGTLGLNHDREHDQSLISCSLGCKKIINMCS